MRVVLAAIDASPAARAVLETALRLARLTGGEATAVHVRAQAGAPTPEEIAAHSGVPLRLLDGAVDELLLEAVATPEVDLAVLGARGVPGGRRPVGGTALRVLERAGKPIVVVPPEAAGASPRPFHRILVPLEGTAASSRPVAANLERLVSPGAEVVVLHVYTGATMPRMLDRPLRDVELLGAEFLARHLPSADRIEFRSGPVDRQVLEVSRDEQADLLVLTWSRSPGMRTSAVVRGVLGHSLVPVLLLPAAPAPVAIEGSEGPGVAASSAGTGAPGRPQRAGRERRRR